MPVFRNHSAPQLYGVPSNTSPLRLRLRRMSTSGLPEAANVKVWTRTDKTQPASPVLPTIRACANIRARRLGIRREDAIVVANNSARSSHQISGMPSTSDNVPFRGSLRQEAPITTYRAQAGILSKASAVPVIRAHEVNFSPIQTFTPSLFRGRVPRMTSEVEYLLLLRLGDSTSGGLSEADFRGLFVKCGRCLAYMTRGQIGYHVCKTTESDEVIDLTGEDD